MEALMMALYITDECNRACDRCYREKSDQKMMSPVAELVGAWIVRTVMCEDVKNLNVSFLGGEPAKNAGVMFHLIDYLDSHLPNHLPLKCAFNEIGIHYRMFTNGDLLTDDILRNLKARRIMVMLNPTDDPISSIEGKITGIKRICGGCNLAIALNEMNLRRIGLLTELAIKYHCHIRANRLYDGGNIPGYVEEYKKGMQKMLDALLAAERPVWPNWIMESTYPTWEGPKNPYSCGRWFAVIDPDGTIRSCNPDVETAIGHVSTTEWKDLKFPQRWSAKNLPECQGCEWITWCLGGCPYTRKLSYGTYNRRTPFCPAFKELFPTLMALKERWIAWKNRG